MGLARWPPAPGDVGEAARRERAALMWPIYSERFIATAGVTGGIYRSFRVPVGKRAVVKSICAANTGTTAGEATVYLENAAGYVFFYSAAFQAQRDVKSLELSVTVYGSETINSYTAGGNIGLVVSGFLFDDPDSRTGPPALVTELPAQPDGPPQLKVG